MKRTLHHAARWLLTPRPRVPVSPLAEVLGLVSAVVPFVIAAVIVRWVVG